MRTRNQVPFFVSAAMGGAAMAYFLDPQNGRRRRHQSRDQLVSLVRHATSDAAGQARRAAHAIRPSAEVELDDATLVDKVESIVFRNHDLPKGQININAENGVVFLRGQVERSELVEALEKRVRKVNGVKDVENLLHTPETGPRES
jgi:osmotically-inducible protein OsmY